MANTNKLLTLKHFFLMKKFFMAIMAVAALTMVGCKDKGTNPGGGEVTPPAPEKKIPTEDAVKGILGDKFDANHYYVVIKSVEEVCNDIIFPGSYNMNPEKPSDWSTAVDEKMLRFEALKGYEGWYIVTVPFDATEDVTNSGKPVQLGGDNGDEFSWDYQSGDVDSWSYIDGEVAEINPGFEAEANVNWPTAGIYIYELKYWKNHNSPCKVVVKHDYEITVIAPAPGENGYKPGIIGDFNGWGECVEMTLVEGNKYTYKFNDAEGHGFKIKEATDTDWTNEIQKFVVDEETGEESWQNMSNTILGETEKIVLDYSDPKQYRWALYE